MGMEWIRVRSHGDRTSQVTWEWNGSGHRGIGLVRSGGELDTTIKFHAAPSSMLCR